MHYDLPVNSGSMQKFNFSFHLKQNFILKTCFVQNRKWIFFNDQPKTNRNFSDFIYSTLTWIDRSTKLIQVSMGNRICEGSRDLTVWLLRDVWTSFRGAGMFIHLIFQICLHASAWVLLWGSPRQWGNGNHFTLCALAVGLWLSQLPVCINSHIWEILVTPSSKDITTNTQEAGGQLYFYMQKKVFLSKTKIKAGNTKISIRAWKRKANTPQYVVKVNTPVINVVHITMWTNAWISSIAIFK